MGLGIFLLSTSHSFIPQHWGWASPSPFDRQEDQSTGSFSNRPKVTELVNCKTGIQTRTSGWRVHALGLLHDPCGDACGQSSTHGHMTVIVSMHNLPTAFPDNLVVKMTSDSCSHCCFCVFCHDSAEYSCTHWHLCVSCSNLCITLSRSFALMYS